MPADQGTGPGSREGARELIAEAAGDLLERFGMRRVLGRVWAALFLSEEPLDAEELRRLLGVSAGTLSMGLNELIELGLVRRETARTSRRFYYSAEDELWSLITTIYKERERERIAASVDKLRTAAGLLEGAEGGDHALNQARHLVEVSGFVLDLADAFVDRTKVEVKAARKWLSVSGRLGGEPLSRLRRRINAVRTEKRR